MTRRIGIVAFAALLISLTGLAAARTIRRGRVRLPASAHATRPAAIARPNLDLYVYRRCYTPDERVALRLSAYNETRVEFHLYRLDLPALTPTSDALTNFGRKIAAVDIARLPAATSWTYALGKVYPDQWAEREVDAPRLAPGVYLVTASGAGAAKRTWFAVTRYALVTKQSQQSLLVYACDAVSGAPAAGVALSAVDTTGRRIAGATDKDGLVTLDTQSTKGDLWLWGMCAGSPLFALSGPPAAPNPYTVYAYTDRPIYRPGQKVFYKGTVRERVEADSPGGFLYVPYAGKKATVEIRDATDALISRQEVTTNMSGSFDGSLQLAGEPVLGSWQLITIIGDRRTYASFDVQAYRKPEYTVDVSFDKDHYLGGDMVPVTISANYFFGQPVAGAPVSYAISFDGPGDTEPTYDGQGVTNSQGKLALQIKTKRLPDDRTLTVNATVTDLSRRSQQGSGSAQITAGLFRLIITPDRYLYRPGDTARLAVQAADYDGKPVAAKVRVELIETKEDRYHRPYEEKTTRDIATDSAGKGEAEFALPRPGYLTVTATAFDSESDKIEATDYIWVAGSEFEGNSYPTLSLVPDKDSYRPGETASLLLNTSLVSASKSAPGAPRHRNAWALATVEGERLYSSRVVALTSPTTLLRVPLTASYFPSVQVDVVIVQDKHIYEQEAQLAVARHEQKLQVSVAPESDQFKPGQTATYTVTTRDYKGRPVAAEVSLGVVDASIYAIEPDSTPDPESVFYSGQEVRVATGFSFAAQYSGGAYQTVGGAGGAGGIRVRRQFADTAYWNPYVETDKTGTAKVSFTVPDNLTTWRATARAITPDTAVGEATHDTVSTMPLLVRLELPRFYVDGDQAVVSAIVQNYTGAERTVKARIEASGAALAGDPERTLDLPAGGQQRIDWRATIAGAGIARFTVTADGGAGAGDAMELDLPVEPDAAPMVDARAGSLEGGSARQSFDLAGLPAGASVKLTLSPSIASAVFDALHDLASYPYGCAEQTMSSFLPDIAVAQALHASRVPVPHLSQMVSLGLQKLYYYQHPDGGWNWWEFDQTDGDMTAYVLYGLIEARDAGFLVDPQRIARGTQALIALLPGQQELGKRADWLLTIAYAQPSAAEAPLAALYEKRDKLDTYGLASLCLALARLGSQGAGRDAAGESEKAAAVARELQADAVAAGTSVHWSVSQKLQLDVSWSAEEGGYSWRDGDDQVTAHVLRALLDSDPNSPLIPGAVRWLMANREDAMWSSTRASAEAVMALSAFMEKSGELSPNFHAEALLDGKEVGQVDAGPRSAFAPPTTITLAAADLAGHKKLTIDKSGSGVLYYSETVSYLVPPDKAAPVSRGLSLRRLYEISAADPTAADAQQSGDEITVTEDIVANSNYKYVVLEERIPAGCEVLPDTDDNGEYDFGGYSGGAAREEVRDNKVVFFFDDLAKGDTQVTYRLRAETPGIYHILPSAVYLNYFPEVRADTGFAGERIEDSAATAQPRQETKP